MGSLGKLKRELTSSAVLLTGGKSSRMGFPKASIKFGSKKIIEIVLEKLKQIFDEIIIVGNNSEDFPGDKNINKVKDIIEDCGPLGGIYTGLKTISNPQGFFLACDMPFLHIGLIKRLLDASKNGSFDCVIPYHIKKSRERIEPLYGLYSKRILKRLEDFINRRELSVRQFLRSCNCKYIKAEGDEVSSFFNINTPRDLKEIIYPWK